MLNKEFYENWVRELSDDALDKCIVFFTEELKENHIENIQEELEYKLQFALLDKFARDVVKNFNDKKGD